MFCKRICFAITILIFIVIFQSGVQANPVEYFGLGPRAASMGGAYTALADDFTSTYYNMAGLVQQEGFSFDLGIASNSPDIKIDGKKQDLENAQGFIVGIAQTLGGKFNRRLAVGLGAFLPSGGAIKVSSPPIEEPHVLKYLNTRHLFGGVGVAAKLTSFLYMGVGVNLLVSVRGPVMVNLNLCPALDMSNCPEGATEKGIKGDLNLTVGYEITPVGGIILEPMDTLKIGAAYRGELALPIDLNIGVDTGIDLSGFGIPQDIPIYISTDTLYLPQQIALGLSYDLLRFLTLALDLTWKDYSKFKSNLLEFRMDEVEEGFVQDLLKPDPLPAEGFKDTYLPRLGVRYELFEDFYLLGGYYYDPSPAPKPKGKTGILWNDEHVLSLGANLSYPGPFGYFRSVSLDLGFQYHMLDPISVKKASGERLEAEGTVFGTAFMIGFYY